MGKPPALVIIVRHGARLDAADKNWHLTSPTPYDPPLTYGGWAQSRALGVRIASVLRARELAANEDSDDDSIREIAGLDPESRTKTQPKRRREKIKYKVIIHSSPFLRCVQTSVAISAGMGQLHGRKAETNPRTPATLTPKFGMHSGLPHLDNLGGNSPVLSAIPEPKSIKPHILKGSSSQEQFRRPTLRVDAFLGEWLSPGYFENITPPPKSRMMVTAAKAELLRKGDFIEGSTMSESPSAALAVSAASGNFPGGWGSRGWGGLSGSSTPTGGPLESLDSMEKTLPRRNRSHTHSSSGSDKGSPQRKIAGRSSSKSNTSVYVPPQPTYAISPSDPIPKGYVAHARDACIEVDYSWDSMREPQDWGDGGEFGEEWSDMHKRFRRGLVQMIQWYKLHGVGERSEDAESPGEGKGRQDDEDDEETELAIVLVTHSAGCNALIGALTNQPVLLDISMASLTMAVRKHDQAEESPMRRPNGHTDSIPPPRRRSSIDLGLSQDYNITIMANADHLRSGADPLRTPSLASPKIVPQIPSYRRPSYGTTHMMTNSPTTEGYFGFADHGGGGGISSALGSVRRSYTSAAAAPRSYTSSPRIEPVTPLPTGLWGSRRNTHDESISEPGRGTSTHFTIGAAPDEKSSLGSKLERIISVDDRAESKADSSTAEDMKERNDFVSPLPRSNTGSAAHSRSSTGLWGPPPQGSVEGDDPQRARGPKRRWTVDEQGAGLGTVA